MGVPVSAVVVGAMRVLDVILPDGPPGRRDTGPRVRVDLEIEANMTLGTAGAEQTQYVKERWRLVRDASVRTKPPQQAQSFHCPNCGAPFAPAGERPLRVLRRGGLRQAVSTGPSSRSSSLRARGAPAGPHRHRPGGGHRLADDLPSRAAARWAELLRDDPAVTDEALAARLQLIYGELNAAWTGLDLTPVRPYVSDGLFDYLQYWITAYEKQGLRNVLEGMRIVEWKTVKVVRDRHYDALTVRLWGTGRDYTVRAGARRDVVAAIRRRDRLYSEYWTLIRGAGVKGAPRTDKTCPNCGAPLDVNMAGQCEHCGAKITSGEFDWVLSKIEQDDSYTG